MATTYKVFKQASVADDAGQATIITLSGDAVEVETYLLLPDEFGGSPIKQAAEKYGPGVYVAEPVRSFDPKQVTLETKPRVKIG